MEKKYNVIINNSDLKFSGNCKDTTILDEALNSNIPLPHSCKSGACGSCITKLVKGSILLRNKKLIKKQENVFLCQSFGNSKDIVLEYSSKKLKIILDQSKNNFINIPKEYLLQVVANRAITPLVNQLSFFLPSKLNFKFLPGSHMEILSEGVKLKRKYSIMNSPKNLSLRDNILSFLIIRHEKTGFSNFIHKNIKPGDIMSLNGPFNSFYYSINNEPVIGIAGGTGISPILSIILDLLIKNKNADILFFLFFRNREEILEMDTMYKLKEKYKNFNFKISLTREMNLSNSQFLIGRVDKTLEKVFKDLSTHKILISGSDGFVDTSYNHVLKLKGKKENIYFEKYSVN